MLALCFSTFHFIALLCVHSFSIYPFSHHRWKIFNHFMPVDHSSESFTQGTCEEAAGSVSKSYKYVMVIYENMKTSSSINSHVEFW